MRVARLHGVGDLRVTEEAPPEPGPAESLVEVRAVGLCGSDLHWFGEGGIGDAGLGAPLVLGHELAGIVRGGPLDGRLVGVDPAVPCGGCESCLEGNRNLCPSVRFAGHGTQDGGLRELLAWPTHLLHPVPDTFSAGDAAMLEPLGVALHAMDLGHATLGATVTVIGCGPIGLFVVQLARAAGAGRVVAVEPRAHRREAAARFGAQVTLDPETPEFHEQLARATAGRGADLVVEVAGTDAAVAVAVEAARPGATVVLAGIPDQDTTTFPASGARRKGLTLRLSRRMKEMYPRSIALVAAGAVDVRAMVTTVHGLDEAPLAFEVARRRSGLKVLVDPGR